MKTSIQLLLCMVCAFGAIARIQAAQAERAISFAFSGFRQGQDLQGNDKAVPFRYTTKDALIEIGFVEGQDFSNGTLLLIDSLSDTNAVSKIVARKGTVERDVTDLFPIIQGEGIQSSKFVGNSLKSATIYSIDSFEFNTLDFDTNGLSLELQLFSKETQRGLLKRVGVNTFDVVAATLAFDGNGELRDQFGLFAPLKGTVKIGAPKYVP